MATCAWVLWVLLTLPSGSVGKEAAGAYKTFEECQAAIQSAPPAAVFLQKMSKGESHLICKPVGAE